VTRPRRRFVRRANQFGGHAHNLAGQLKTSDDDEIRAELAAGVASVRRSILERE
jgi:hypothetical protein